MKKDIWFVGGIKSKWEAGDTYNLNALDAMFNFIYECTQFNSLRNSFTIKYLQLQNNRNDCY